MKIHQITHQSPLIAKKVNFFADYFEYLVDVIGKDHHLDIENHLSLVEKMIWQMQTNFDKCVPYVSNYIDHPYLQGDDPFVKLFNRHKSLFMLFQIFKSVAVKKRKRWLLENPIFEKKLLAFKRALKRQMVSKALFEIISFLRCVHDLPEHKVEIIYCTKIIVSEFLLNGHSKKDVNEVFSKIMSREVWEFPFPKQISTDEEKINFLSTRTFDQQFQGIFNLLKAKPRTLYFLYRVYGVSVSDEFMFRYRDVTFYSPNCSVLQGISENHIAIPDGLSRQEVLKDNLVAVVKLEFYSIDSAERTVKRIISDSLEFVNGALKTTVHLEANSYLGSNDLKIFHGIWRVKDERSIDEYDIITLKNNPYQFLRGISGPAKRHFLYYEHLFVKAKASNTVEDYWKYLEALIPDSANGENRIRDVVSSIALIIAENSSRQRISDKISWAIQPFSAASSVFGMTNDQQMQYFNEMQLKKKVNLKRLRKEVKHPFVQHLLDLAEAPWSQSHLLEVKQYYDRMLLEAYSQRNAIIHTGEGYNKSLVGVNETLPWIVGKFRHAIFRSLKPNSKLSFGEMIDKEITRMNTHLQQQ